MHKTNLNIEHNKAKLSEGCQLKTSHGHKRESFPINLLDASLNYVICGIIPRFHLATCFHFPQISLVFLSMNSIFSENGNHDCFHLCLFRKFSPSEGEMISN